MGSLSREMEILRKNQKKKKRKLKHWREILKKKGLWWVYDELIGRLDMAEERLSELEDISIGISKTEKQRKQRLKRDRTEYSRTVGQLPKV